MIETIVHGEAIIALVISQRAVEPGIHFLTPDAFAQQLAVMRHPAGKVIASHTHKPVPRVIQQTQETLFVRKGQVRVDFYDAQQNYLDSRVLGAGDVVLLASGGHGFEFLEESEVVEVKQGPYVGADEKVRFAGIAVEKFEVR